MSFGGGILGNGGLGDVLPSDLPEGFEDFGGPSVDQRGQAAPMPGMPGMPGMMPGTPRPMAPQRRPMRRGMGEDAAPMITMGPAPAPRATSTAILAGTTAALVTVGLCLGAAALAHRQGWI